MSLPMHADGSNTLAPPEEVEEEVDGVMVWGASLSTDGVVDVADFVSGTSFATASAGVGDDASTFATWNGSLYFSMMRRRDGTFDRVPKKDRLTLTTADSRREPFQLFRVPNDLKVAICVIFCPATERSIRQKPALE